MKQHYAVMDGNTAAAGTCHGSLQAGALYAREIADVEARYARYRKLADGK